MQFKHFEPKANGRINLIRPVPNQRYKAVALLYWLMQGKSFTVAGERMKLGGDLLDLGLIDREHQNILVMFSPLFKDFLRLAGALDDEDFEKLLKIMIEDFSKR